jgi:acetolactate synthase-1/2/3 large subunit
MNHLQELARQIAADHQRCVFGIPGSGPSLALLDALEKAGVAFQLTHFEGSAAIMAGAAGRLSGRSGVCLSIKGPGLTNMLPGLAACALESFPVVSISEAYLPGTPPQKCHKRIDHDRLLSAFVKHRSWLSSGSPEFRELARLAEAEAPGVVHLDIAEAPAPTTAAAPAPLPIPFAADRMQRAADLLKAAQQPVVIAGTLSIRKNWTPRLNRSAVPVFSTAAAKGAVDETLAHAAGVFTGVGGPLAPEHSILAAADLVVALGLRHNEVLNVQPFACPALHIDPIGTTQSFGFNFDCQLEGTDSQIEAVFGRLDECSWGLDRLAAARQTLTAKMFDRSFLPAHVFRYASAHFHHAARVVLDTGNFCTIGEHAWPVTRPDLYLASGQGRYMGIGLPLAIGAALQDPSVPTLVFTGDGGIGMFVSEVKLAAQHRLPLLVVLMCDAHLSSIRAGSLAKGLTQVPTRVPLPSWRAAMEGLGVPGVVVVSEKDLDDALRRWKSDGPLYLEARFDPERYQRMTAGIR